MANLRLKIELNKGERGIPIDKLEKVVQEMRKFLESMADDIELAEPESWVCVDFENSSLMFASEYSHAVAGKKLAVFNDTIVALAKSEFPQSIQRSTANKFFQLASVLEQDETAVLSVFSQSNSPIPMQISQSTATLARLIKVLPFRETIGSVQGKIHSLFKESKPHPYFTLRELATDHLIKCVYQPSAYPVIIRALGELDQVIHVRGHVVTDTRGHSIHHLDVIEIMQADPYGFDDVEKFFGILRKQ